MHPLDETRFWLQVNEDSKRTVYTSPENAERVHRVLDRFGMNNYEVRATPVLNGEMVVVVDPHGQDAQMNENLQRMRRRDV